MRNLSDGPKRNLEAVFGRKNATHHFPLLFQDKWLPRPLPEAQGFVMGCWHYIVSIGTECQAPHLLVMPLQVEKKGKMNNTSPSSWEKCLSHSDNASFQEPPKLPTSNVWMCSNLSASHCLILLSFPAVKKRWDLATNWRYITLGRQKSRRERDLKTHMYRRQQCIPKPCSPHHHLPLGNAFWHQPTLQWPNSGLGQRAPEGRSIQCGQWGLAQELCDLSSYQTALTTFVLVSHWLGLSMESSAHRFGANTGDLAAKVVKAQIHPPGEHFWWLLPTTQNKKLTAGSQPLKQQSSPQPKDAVMFDQPVIMGKERAVTVPKIQAPNLHIPVGRPSCNQSPILQRNAWNGVGRWLAALPGIINRLSSAKALAPEICPPDPSTSSLLSKAHPCSTDRQPTESTLTLFWISVGT